MIFFNRHNIKCMSEIIYKIHYHKTFLKMFSKAPMHMRGVGVESTNWGGSSDETSKTEAPDQSVVWHDEDPSR